MRTKFIQVAEHIWVPIEYVESIKYNSCYNEEHNKFFNSIQFRFIKLPKEFIDGELRQCQQFRATGYSILWLDHDIDIAKKQFEDYMRKVNEL